MYCLQLMPKLRGGRLYSKGTMSDPLRALRLFLVAYFILVTVATKYKKDEKVKKTPAKKCVTMFVIFIDYIICQ